MCMRSSLVEMMDGLEDERQLNSHFRNIFVFATDTHLIVVFVAVSMEVKNRLQICWEIYNRGMRVTSPTITYPI